jgi:hypothetical protein
MTGADTAPELHQSLQDQLAVARLELDDIATGLWQAVGYNKDVIGEALAVFPEPSQRRSDTPFTCEPDEEVRLRSKAAILGPGRKDTETLEDLGVYRVDAEVIEPGQLHKTVTEVWRALVSGHQAPIILFASDRPIPQWAKDKDKQDKVNEQLDAERLSSDRLLVIGGQGLSTSTDFFYRAGGFDHEAKARKAADSAQKSIWDRALALPNTEYDMTEKFLGSALDETADSVLPIGYDPENGQVLTDTTGQVRRLGTIAGRDVILVHKEKREDGTALDTTDTVLLMGGIASAVTSTPETVMSYWTSATYKPSRWMSGIRAGIRAAQDGGTKLRVAVPTYGYADLSKIKGEQKPTPPTIQNVAGEMGKAAQEAFDLRAFLETL